MNVKNNFSLLFSYVFVQAVKRFLFHLLLKKASTILVMSTNILRTCKFVEDYDYGHDDGDAMIIMHKDYP